jgi:hypothetical protein
MELGAESTSTSIDPEDRGLVVPDRFTLEQNYPNPFNPSTQIRFSLADVSEVRLEVFNLLGQSVAVLLDGRMGAGVHSVAFDGSGLSSGAYLYRITTPAFTQTRLMTLLK